MTIKRYQPRDTPYCEMDALPDGEYVRYEDYAELLGHVEAIGAGGVSPLMGNDSQSLREALEAILECEGLVITRSAYDKARAALGLEALL